MTTLDWMDVIYPWTASGFAGYVACKLTWRILVRNHLDSLPPSIMVYVQRIVELDIFIGLTELLVLTLLGVSTGRNPIFDIDEYRQYVVIVRFAMGLGLYFSIITHVLAFTKFYRWRRVVR